MDTDIQGENVKDVKMLKLKFELQVLLHFHFCGGILHSSVLRFLGNGASRKISCNIKVL